MAFSLVASVTAGPGSDGGSTAAINTTGSNLLIMSCGWYSDPTTLPSDSKSNTWTPLTIQTNSALSERIFYSVPTSVGSGHTFDFSNPAGIYPSIVVTAWSGASASPLDQQTGTVDTSVNTIQPGSLTPSENDCLVITALALENNLGGAISINGGFTALTEPYNSGVTEGGSQGYLVQTTAAAANPTWDVTNTTTQLCVTIAVFKSGGGGGGGNPWYAYAQQ